MNIVLSNHFQLERRSECEIFFRHSKQVKFLEFEWFGVDSFRFDIVDERFFESDVFNG